MIKMTKEVWLLEISGVILTCDWHYGPQLSEEIRTSTKDKVSERTVSRGIVLVRGLDASASLRIYKNLLEGKPIFLRHMFPVLLELGMCSSEQLAEAAFALLKESGHAGSISMQCRIVASDVAYKPLDVKNAFDKKLFAATGSVTATRGAAHILSVLICEQSIFLGVSSSTENLNSWSGGAVHYGGEDNLLSRSRHKLEEALEVMKIDLSAVKDVLDLGAAPGG
ncbi:MAG: hypothetical protein Q8N36_04790 [bacterium]|nr:hypothetical protein [bacterium]